MRPGESKIWIALKNHPEGLTFTELKEITKLSSTSLSQYISSFLKKGIIRRDPDRRKYLIVKAYHESKIDFYAFLNEGLKRSDLDDFSSIQFNEEAFKHIIGSIATSGYFLSDIENVINLACEELGFIPDTPARKLREEKYSFLIDFSLELLYDFLNYLLALTFREVYYKYSKEEITAELITLRAEKMKEKIDDWFIPCINALSIAVESNLDLYHIFEEKALKNILQVYKQSARA